MSTCHPDLFTAVFGSARGRNLLVSASPDVEGWLLANELLERPQTALDALYRHRDLILWDYPLLRHLLCELCQRTVRRRETEFADVAAPLTRLLEVCEPVPPQSDLGLCLSEDARMWLRAGAYVGLESVLGLRLHYHRQHTDLSTLDRLADEQLRESLPAAVASVLYERGSLALATRYQGERLNLGHLLSAAEITEAIAASLPRDSAGQLLFDDPKTGLCWERNIKRLLRRRTPAPWLHQARSR